MYSAVLPPKPYSVHAPVTIPGAYVELECPDADLVRRLAVGRAASSLRRKLRNRILYHSSDAAVVRSVVSTAAKVGRAACGQHAGVRVYRADFVVPAYPTPARLEVAGLTLLGEARPPAH
jgi:hypothetical protein